MRPGWKVLGFTLVTVLGACLLSIYISVRLAERSQDEATAREEQARREQRDATCQVVSTILAAYEEAPPSTPAGKAVAEAWLYEYRILGCTPKK